MRSIFVALAVAVLAWAPLQAQEPAEKLQQPEKHAKKAAKPADPKTRFWVSLR